MVALVFLVLGFQLAVFVMKVVERPGCPVEPGMTERAEASGDAGVFGSREHFPCERDEKQSSGASETTSSAAERTASGRSKFGGYERPTAVNKPVRTYESFTFDPNTVSLEDMQRLGLSQRQAESIENYRAKGGRFRSKADFQKMYVVSDSLYARLEPYIDIPKLELNTADSAALVALRGIGPYYARKILDYRDRLGGFHNKAQLLEIDGLDAERYEGLCEDIIVDTTKIRPLDLWHASDTILSRHPYLGLKGARSIVRYRQLYDTTRWTLHDLASEHVLSKENIEKLKKYIDIQ